MLLRDFYLRDANLVAQDLIGKKLVHNSNEGLFSGLIVEVEAYIGPNDKASHAFNNRYTKRTKIQYGIGGFTYVYLIYGKYYCFNVVTSTFEKPEVVLIRALQPIDGIEKMQSKRNCKRVYDLCNGPGKLCMALDIAYDDYGKDLCDSNLYLEEGIHYSRDQICVSPRVNIDYADESKDLLWRYYIKNNKFVSKVPKRYASDITLADLS